FFFLFFPIEPRLFCSLYPLRVKNIKYYNLIWNTTCRPLHRSCSHKLECFIWRTSKRKLHYKTFITSIFCRVGNILCCA
ncbi:unnamed protein product, partial [Ixodes pacificus]